MRVGQDSFLLSHLVPETAQRMWHPRLCISKENRQRKSTLTGT